MLELSKERKEEKKSHKETCKLRSLKCTLLNNGRLVDSQRGTVEHIIKQGFFQTHQALKTKIFFVSRKWESLQTATSTKLKFRVNINNFCACPIKTEFCHNYRALLQLCQKVVVVEGRVSSLFMWYIHFILYISAAECWLCINILINKGCCTAHFAKDHLCYRKAHKKNKEKPYGHFWQTN